MALHQISALTKLLINNPNEIKDLFTVVFGKYLLNYYPDTKDYSVSFDYSAESSYQDSRNKRIVIAMSNVVLLLKNNIHPFAVAYHELAHVLYTSDSKRDKIRKKVIDILYGMWGFRPNSQLPHSIWNILEDERIERKIVKDYPFLKTLINPLRTAVTEDGKLMSWRTQIDLSKVPADIVQQAELYANKDLKTDDCVNIIIYIIDQHYKPAPGQGDGEDIADKMFKDGDGDADDGMGGGSDTTDQDGDEVEEESDGEEDSEEDSDSVLDDIFDEDDEELTDEELLERIAKNESKEKTAKELKDINKTIDELKGMTSNDPQEEALRRMLLEVKEAQKTQHDLQQYNDAVKVLKPIKDTTKRLPRLDMCRNIINLSQDIKGGLTAAERKSYSSNISNRINVQKIIDSSASKREPRVFYGKGKDVSYLRKVVIFEDVSGSTSGMTTSIFSDIAYNLQKSFEGAEWWVYADRLGMKPKQDYMYKSYDTNLVYNCGGGTSSDNLVHVMRKYRKENAIFVIITDGDVYPLVNSQDNLFQEFKDRTVLIGVGLNNDIVESVPNKHDITDSFRQLDDLWRNRDRDEDNYDYSETYETNILRKNPNIKKKFEEIVADSVRSLMPIIKGRLK